jgi:hypothetical protein
MVQSTLGDILRARFPKEKTDTEKAFDSINPLNYTESEMLALTPIGVKFLFDVLTYYRDNEAEASDMSLIVSLQEKLINLKQPI